MVEAASAFLMSSFAQPMMAPNSSVTAPTITTAVWAAGARLNSGPERTIRYTPAVTMVAAWISADTGWGPSMASPQPGLQRHLGALAARAEQQQQADRGQRCPRSSRARRRRPGEADRADRREHDHQGDRQAHVARPG